VFKACSAGKRALFAELGHEVWDFRQAAGVGHWNLLSIFSDLVDREEVEPVLNELLHLGPLLAVTLLGR